MKKNILRNLIGAIVCLMSLSAMADNQIVIKDFAIKPGETKVVEVVAESDEPIRAFEVVFVLPEGLTIDTERAQLTNRANGHSLSGRLTSKGYRFLAFSLNGDTFAGTDGVILEVPVTASADFAHSGVINANDIVMENANGDALVDMGKAESMAYIEVSAPTPTTTDNGD